jgi:hypothetical protein
MVEAEGVAVELTEANFLFFSRFFICFDRI